MDNTLLSKWWDDRLRTARLVDIERHLNAAGRPAGGRRVEAMDVCLTKEYVEAKDKPTLNSAIERCDKRLP